MMRFADVTNTVTVALFLVCYFYQFLYIPTALLRKLPAAPQAAPGRIAVLIAARNEEAVLGNLLGSSCNVSGTGFLFSDRILQKYGGWNFFLLVEDIEFSIDNILDGEKIAYCENAMLYDEQPTDFAQSVRQRMRWSRGYLQVIGKYGRCLFAGIFRGDFSCFDMTMNILPAAILTVTNLTINLGCAIAVFVSGGDLQLLLLSLLKAAGGIYLTAFVLGMITTITERKQIHASALQKILYMFTFPLFMFTYVPICIAALFINPGWKPIRHECAKTIDQM